ncbi:MAG: hypothetical protein J5854_05280 [Clostridia bacterium]|nr:hypothetical protein [Clostridia bacterium]
MLFGVSFCKRGQRVRKRRPDPGMGLKLCVLLLSGAVFTALLFLAPQWLLVLLVLLLTAGILLLIFLPG